MKIANYSIRHPVTTLIGMGAILIFGWLSFRSMGLDLFPEVDIPVVTVTTTLPGSSPEEIDQDVTDALEEQLNTISGLDFMQSSSFEGVSSIVMNFELSKDINIAMQDVRSKVNLASSDLPDDANEPIVQKIDIAAAPIMYVSVSGDVDYQRLAEYADQSVKNKLSSVPGVGNIQLSGLREPEIRIWLHPDELTAHDLTATDVYNEVESNHLELPGGRIEQKNKEFTIKVNGEYPSAKAMRSLVVKEEDGQVTYLSDVARVQQGTEDYRTIAHYNGHPTIGLGIRKQSGANTVAVANQVRERVQQIKKNAPKGINVEVSSDNSTFIKDSISGVQFDIVFGVLLTAVVMFLFLRNFRVTVISMISIPISLIGGFMLMNALDFTINNLTMLAMSLAVGLVIDDTIVVLENIFRHVEEGEDAREAAKSGTSEVGFAVIAATSTLVAVFLPVALMKGIIGRFFFQFGLTVAITVFISAFVSLTITPYLASRWIERSEKHGRIYNALTRGLEWMDETYVSGLEWAVGNRGWIILIAIVAFVGGMAILPFLGAEFIPQADRSQYQVDFELSTGSSIENTNQQLYKIEQTLFKFDEVESVFSTVGSGQGQNVNKGTIVVNLVKPDERSYGQGALMDSTRDVIKKKFPDVTASVGEVSNVGGGGRQSDVQLIVQGPSVEELSDLRAKVIGDLKKVKNFVGIDSDLRLSKPKINVDINRSMAYNLGISAREISSNIYTLFGGRDVAKYTRNGYRYKIRMKAAPSFTDHPDALSQIHFRGSSGKLIKAANVIDNKRTKGPNVINRYNRLKSITFYANVTGELSAGEGLTKMQNILDKYVPDNGNWRVSLGGQSKTFRESFGYLLTALLIAILVIYMVLAVQFESFIHPFTIMISLPLTIIGVAGSLLLTGTTLNIFSFIGIIMLIGLVVKNSILLVDLAEQKREAGEAKVKAMLIAGEHRLRPILMTALTVIFGLLPVALALSEGGGQRAPLGIAVIGGMVTSTFLTLLVIPIVYLLFDDATEWTQKKIKSFRNG